MFVENDIRDRLQVFQPSVLEITNESHRHAGHGGDDGSGESHFAVKLRAEVLAEMSRVDRHRAVQRALGDINQRVHALALDLG